MRPFATKDVPLPRLFAAADMAGLGALYGDDSIVSFDGASIKGRAAIVGAMTPRVRTLLTGIRHVLYL